MTFKPAIACECRHNLFGLQLLRHSHAAIGDMESDINGFN